jgi:hypothetical protein
VHPQVSWIDDMAPSHPFASLHRRYRLIFIVLEITISCITRILSALQRIFLPWPIFSWHVSTEDSYRLAHVQRASEKGLGAVTQCSDYSELYFFLLLLLSFPFIYTSLLCNWKNTLVVILKSKLHGWHYSNSDQFYILRSPFNELDNLSPNHLAFFSFNFFMFSATIL